jgi:hypothetical protein
MMTSEAVSNESPKDFAKTGRTGVAMPRPSPRIKAGRYSETMCRVLYVRPLSGAGAVGVDNSWIREAISLDAADRTPARPSHGGQGVVTLRLV